MAREHLFRGFHECASGDTVITLDGEKIRGKWVKGGHIKGYRHCTSLYAPIDYEVHYITYYDKEQQMFIDKEVIAETVCECAGLPDKNGKNIFEGDILKVYETEEHYQKILVEYKNGQYQVSHYAINLLASRNLYSEVIGNIFENPELLEKN